MKEPKELFSAREMEILLELRVGHTSAEIARQFCISKHTVDTHRRNMLRKAKVANTMKLIAYYESSLG